MTEPASLINVFLTDYISSVEKSNWQNYNLGAIIPSRVWHDSDGLAILSSSGVKSIKKITHQSQTKPSLRITRSTLTRYIQRSYNLVVVIDCSPSLLSPDAHLCVPPIAEADGALGKVFQNLASFMECADNPEIGGESIIFSPALYISVIICPQPPSQPSIIIQNFLLTSKSVFELIKIVKTGIMSHLRKFLHLTTHSLSHHHFASLESILDIASKTLDLLPRSGSPNILLVTDGVATLPSSSQFIKNPIRELIRRDISVHCLQLGVCSGVHSALGCIPDAEALQFLCTATGGFLVKSSDMTDFITPKRVNPHQNTSTQSKYTSPPLFSTGSWSALQISFFLRYSVLPPSNNVTSEGSNECYDQESIGYTNNQSLQELPQNAVSFLAGFSGSSEAIQLQQQQQQQQHLSQNMKAQAPSESSQLSLLPAMLPSSFRWLSPGGAEGIRVLHSPQTWASSLHLTRPDTTTQVASTMSTGSGDVLFPWHGPPPPISLSHVRVASFYLRADPRHVLSCRLKEGYRIIPPPRTKMSSEEGQTTQLVLLWQPHVLILFQFSKSPSSPLLRVAVDIIAQSDFAAIYSAVIANHPPYTLVNTSSSSLSSKVSKKNYGSTLPQDQQQQQQYQQIIKPLSRLTSSAVGPQRARHLFGFLKVQRQTDAVLAHLCSQPSVVALQYKFINFEKLHTHNREFLFYTPFLCLSSSSSQRWFTSDSIEVTLRGEDMYLDISEAFFWNKVGNAVLSWAHVELSDIHKVFSVDGTATTSFDEQHYELRSFIRFSNREENAIEETQTFKGHTGGLQPFVIVRFVKKSGFGGERFLSVLELSFFGCQPPQRRSLITSLKRALKNQGLCVISRNISSLIIPALGIDDHNAGEGIDEYLRNKTSQGNNLFSEQIEGDNITESSSIQRIPLCCLFLKQSEWQGDQLFSSSQEAISKAEQITHHLVHSINEDWTLIYRQSRRSSDTSVSSYSFIAQYIRLVHISSQERAALTHLKLNSVSHVLGEHYDGDRSRFEQRTFSINSKDMKITWQFHYAIENIYGHTVDDYNTLLQSNDNEMIEKTLIG